MPTNFALSTTLRDSIRRRWLRHGAAVAALAVSLSAQALSPVFLANSDFESNPLAAGQFLATTAMNGWTVLPRAPGSALVVGLFYPDISFYSYTAERPFGAPNAAAIGMQGPQALILYLPKAGEGVSHALPAMPGGKLYRVSVALGSRLSDPSSFRFGGARLALVNGKGQTLAFSDVTRLPRSGVFQDVSFEADLGAAGCSDCSLRITSLGLADSGGYVDLDNLRVDMLDGAAAADAAGLTLDLPMARQVIQRHPLADGTGYAFSVPVLGHAWGATRVTGATVTASLLGADGLPVPGVPANQPLSYNAATGLFNGRISGTLDKGGNFTVTVRISAPSLGQRERQVADVGVGDVFLIAGQSNSAAFGSWGAVPYVATNTQARVADIASGAWAPLITDPLPSISGGYGSGGSAWARFGELASQRAGVPIGVVAVGWGGTAAAQWLPSTGLYEVNFGWALRFLEPGGFKAVMWHQGESDTLANTSYGAYYTTMAAVINGVRRKAGFEVPWYEAEVSAITTSGLSPRGRIAAAERLLTRTLDGVYPGASTDYLFDSGYFPADNPAHLNAQGLELHARQWAAIVEPGEPTVDVWFNGDFADTPLAPGQIVAFTAGPNATRDAGKIIKGWYASDENDTGLTASGTLGVWSPTSTYYRADHYDSTGRLVPMGATDAMVGFLYGVPTGASLYQSANMTGQPGASYTLSVRLGRRLGSDASFAPVRIELLLGGRAVAYRSVELADMGAAGSFITLPLSYAVPASAAPGQRLGARIKVTRNGSSANYVDIDGVSLSANPLAPH